MISARRIDAFRLLAYVLASAHQPGTLSKPVAAAWNLNAKIEGEAREHEAGHAASAHLVGSEVAGISMDAKWTEFGELGRVSFKWFGTNREELAFARGIVAQSGLCSPPTLGTRSSRGDRAKVEAIKFSV